MRPGVDTTKIRMRPPRRLPLPLRSPRLTIRLPTPADVEDYYRILSAPEVRRLMQPEEPWTRDMVRANIALRRREAREGSRYDLAVELRSIRRVVGRVALKGIDLLHARAELAYWFGPDYWGHAFATEAAYTLCRAAFRDLHLHRIDAQAHELNERSTALLERLGFREEGTLREAFRYQKHRVAMLQFGLLRGDLRAPK